MATRRLRASSQAVHCQPEEDIMFGLGTGELLIILLIALLVFGASRLPELGKGLGQGMRGFRDALKGVE
ncbi:MAG TPA: twin-arginine translocase TatA/TatE family subunit, partial [Myxococcota bacterium]|nr:twin-arginine translocase TatA/TatE family subunit [Myxococcota bacterium]